MPRANDTIILQVDPPADRDRCSILPDDLAVSVRSLEKLYAVVARLAKMPVEVVLFITDVEYGSVDFHFHAHYRPADSGRRRPDLDKLSTVGTNAFVLMVAAVQLAVALKSPTQEPPRVDIEVPAPLLADPAFTIAVDDWVRDAMRLGGRVTLRVPEAPPLEIVQDYARGKVASQSTRRISKKLIGRTGPGGLFTAPITRLSEDFTVTYHTVARKGFLAEMVLPERGGPAKSGPRTRTVFVVWASKAPSPESGAPLTVQCRLTDPESVRLQAETPAAVQRADGVIVVEAAQTWM